ncbi:MAG: hypothetical protein KatS3mg105_0638 [Gemmatales bacterium]|nr:MAG: hypothetical protein KatS3mg105_0638 [Gemmatales bacterium]
MITSRNVVMVLAVALLATGQGTAQPVYHYAPYFTATGESKHDVPNRKEYQLTRFSLAAWFKTTTNFEGNIRRFIVNRGGFGVDDPTLKNPISQNYYICMRYGGQVEAGFEEQNGKDHFVRSDKHYNDGKWHYVVYTFNGNTNALYIDGQLVKRGFTDAIPDTRSIAPFRVGTNSYDGLVKGRYFIGSIDEVRLWNYALDPSKINTTEGEIIYLPFGPDILTFYDLPNANRLLPSGVIDAVKRAKDRILIDTNLLDTSDASASGAFWKEVINAHKRGLKVEVLCSTRGQNDASVKALQAAGINVRRNAIHAKILVVDDAVYVGSHNYNHNGFQVNIESTLRIVRDDVVKKAVDYHNQAFNGTFASLKDGGGDIALLTNGYQPALLNAINGAQKRIWLTEYSAADYVENNNDPMSEVARAIVAAKQRGVEVRIAGGRNFDNATLKDYFLKNGVDYRSAAGETYRQHAKIAIIDDRMVFVGSHDWADITSTTDMTVKVDVSGKYAYVLTETVEFFEKIWPPLPQTPDITPFYDLPKGTRLLADEVIPAVKKAKTRILVDVFLADLGSTADDFWNAVVAAKNRGVKVEVVTNGDRSGVAAGWLRVRGIPVVEKDIHTKMLIVDDAVYIGSHNYNHNGLAKNIEATLKIERDDVLKKAVDYHDKVFNKGNGGDYLSLVDNGGDVEPLSDGFYDAMKKAFDGAQKRVYVTTYTSFEYTEDDDITGKTGVAKQQILVSRLARALAAAKQRGVDVRFIAGRSAHAKTKMRNFLKANVSYRHVSDFANDPDEWIQHAKIAIIDDHTVFVGSHNWDFVTGRGNVTTKVKTTGKYRFLLKETEGYFNKIWGPRQRIAPVCRWTGETRSVSIQCGAGRLGARGNVSSSPALADVLHGTFSDSFVAVEAFKP